MKIEQFNVTVDYISKYTPLVLIKFSDPNSGFVLCSRFDTGKNIFIDQTPCKFSEGDVSKLTKKIKYAKIKSDIISNIQSVFNSIFKKRTSTGSESSSNS